MIGKNTEKGNTVYYNNNEATFCCFLPGNIALVVVKILPISDENIMYGTCPACLVGNSDNKLECTCDDYIGIYEEILEQQQVTEIVITAPVSMLYEKPFALVKADKYVKDVQFKIDTVKKELKGARQELREILALHAVIKSNIMMLKEQQETLKEIS